MASLDEVFSSMPDMGGEEDGALDFLIDEDLRIIAVPERGVVLGVEGDKDVNRVRFRMNRFYKGSDLSEFQIRINYQNADGDRNYFTVTEKTVDADHFSFIWMVAADAVATKGIVLFVVNCFTADDSGIVQKAYHTTLGTASALEGLEVDVEGNAPQIVDFMGQLKNDLRIYVGTLVTDTEKFAAAAANSARAAATSEKNAKTFAENAASSAGKAVKDAAALLKGYADSALESKEAAAASQTAAKASETESAKNLQGTKEYFEQVRTITIGAQGWYATPEALKTAVPVGENGWWAVVGATDTIWTWDSDTGTWKDSVQKADLSDYYTRSQTDQKLSEKLSNRPATASTLGGVKVGGGLSVTADGTLSVTSVGGFSIRAQTTDPGVGSPLPTGTILLVYK